MNLPKSVDNFLPRPERATEYRPPKYIFPIKLMFNGGSRGMEKTRQIRNDKATGPRLKKPSVYKTLPRRDT